jgi:hypothetical protein
MSETEWNSFHIWRTWEGDDVIAKGPAFATDELLPMLGDLFGFYFDVVGPTLLR